MSVLVGNQMLTSERKLQKLFIKFIEWGHVIKAENLIKLHSELEIPWQKAFESATMNKMERGAIWIYDLACKRGVKIDIHFDNDKLLNYLILQDCRYFLKWLIGLESNYPWQCHITNENLTRANKDTLAIIP